MTKYELYEKMKSARSWAEFGMTVSEVCNVLADDCKEYAANSNEQDFLKTIQELNDKIARLTTTNKQLRAENKTLRAEGKE